LELPQSSTTQHPQDALLTFENRVKITDETPLITELTQELDLIVSPTDRDSLPSRFLYARKPAKVRAVSRPAAVKIRPQHVSPTPISLRHSARYRAEGLRHLPTQNVKLASYKTAILDTILPSNNSLPLPSYNNSIPSRTPSPQNNTMSRFYPHPPYAEDQPLSHTILITHCLHRGFTAGGALGAAAGAALSVFSKPTPTRPKIPLTSSILRGAGIGAIIGTGFLAVGVTSRMWGREEIEWKDRAWRLCENEGQKDVDDGSLVGVAVALTAGGLAKGGAMGLGWRGALGGAAVGSLVGGGLWAGFKGMSGRESKNPGEGS
jgi:hypothetical protein